MENEIEDVDAICKKALSPESCELNKQSSHPNINSTHKVFYADPRAEKVLEKIDQFSEEYLVSLMNPDAPIWQVIPEYDRHKILTAVIDHYALRFKFDFAKHKYYHPNEISESAGKPLIQIGFAGEATLPLNTIDPVASTGIPIYE